MPWTEERRQKQREAIKKHRPWEKSTGPKSGAGKENSSLNALKHGARSRAAEAVRRMLQLNNEFRKFYELYNSLDALEKRRTNELIKNRLKSNAETKNPEKTSNELMPGNT